MKSPAALLMLALTLLTSCSAGPPVQRYLLPAGPLPVADSSAPAHTLLVRPVQLAAYLDSQGIVLQLDEITLSQAQNHRWAESLGRLLDRGLRQRLGQRLNQARVLDSGSQAADAWQLSVDVEHFQGHYEGHALASGYWQLQDETGRLITREPFLARAPLQADGYPALVQALGRSWDQVAEQIAGRIRELRQAL